MSSAKSEVHNNRNDAGVGASHGHRQHTQKMVKFACVVDKVLLKNFTTTTTTRYPRGQTHTDTQRERQTYSLQYLAPLQGAK